MVKRSLIVLILVAVVAGGAFAQKNTVTLDVGPTIVGLAIPAAFKALGNSVDENLSINSSGFGIGAQYEYQPFEKVSFAGRFAYLGSSFGYTSNDVGVTAKVNISASSFSVEGHARYYPFTGGVFFVDGMVGYGRLMTDFSGQVIAIQMGTRYAESVSTSPSRNYIKLGGKLGWRKCFGKDGAGFTFEPSVGYSFGIGMGQTIGKQLADSVADATGNVVQDVGDFDDAFRFLEQLVFIGGPRVSLAFGWRF